jgi:beta-mannanase
MELHRRILGALALIGLGALFLVGLAIASDVSDEAGASEAEQVILAASFSKGLQGWRGDRARLSFVRRLGAGDSGAGVTARRRDGRFALALRYGPPQRTTAGDEYTVAAKVKALQGVRPICVELVEIDGDGPIGHLLGCRLVTRRWTAVRADGYTAAGDGNRILVNVYSLARRTQLTRTNRFVVTSVKVTRKCKGLGANSRCGSTGFTTTTTTTTGASTTSPTTTTTATATTTTSETTTSAPTSTSTAPSDPPHSGIDALVPANGVLWGAKPGYSQSEASAFEALVGRTLDIRQVFFDWSQTWPDSRQLDDHARGRIPLISWNGTNLADITSGVYDELIRRRARDVKNLGFPVFIRWAHEMNGSWYVWGKQPNNYVAAWRRIHTIFEQEGALNVAWVWSPSIPQGDWDSYYPGDAYVDWIAGDSYNAGSCRDSGSSWRTFASLFRPYHDHFAGRGKPMMLAEVGSAEQGGSKSAWLTDALGAIKTMPGYRAWIHQQYAEGACDWRANSSESALAAYRALASDPYFNGS